jgi:site-specific DNA recombinase
MTKRAVLYARTSGDDRDRESLSSQLDMCRKHAQERGWLIVGEYAEDVRGVSGADFGAPKLNEALDLARAGGFDVLVVRELDRFARDIAKQYIFEREFNKAGVEVEYALYDFPDTPGGRLQKSIFASFAQFEREQTRLRTKRGIRAKVRAGNVIAHGSPPYGYRLVEKDGKRTLEIYELEARIVRLVFQWYTVGDGERGPMSLRAIAIKLTEMGVPTAKRNSDTWRVSTIHDMLKNETYAGTWHYGKMGVSDDGRRVPNPDESLIPVSVPSIVERETWEKAKERLDYNRRNARRNRKYQYLLSGRVTCGSCGFKMGGKSLVSRGKVYLYYRCPTRDGCTLTYGCECDLPYFRADHVDAAVWAEIRGYLEDDQKLRKGYEKRQAELEKANAPLIKRLAVVKELIAENQQQLERALDLYLSGDFSREILTDRKTRLDETIEALERERDTITAQLQAQTFTEAQVESFERFLEKVSQSLDLADADFEARRRIIEMMNAEITPVIEDGEKVVWLRCIVGECRLSIESTNPRTRGRGTGTKAPDRSRARPPTSARGRFYSTPSAAPPGASPHPRYRPSRTSRLAPAVSWGRWPRRLPAYSPRTAQSR